MEELGQIDGSRQARDVTSSACKISGKGKAMIVVREPMIVCGIKLIPLIADAFGAGEVTLHENLDDGTEAQPGQSIGTLIGPQSQILLIERTVLNFLQKLCGIATGTKRFVSLIEQHGVGLLDTRKTTPGLRSLEKYATGCGGGYNHRMGLYDRILAKDNHLAAASVDNPAKLELFVRDLKKSQPGFLVEVEVDGLDQLDAVLQGGADAVLLDNFSPDDIAKAVNLNHDRAILEASGGINEKNISLYAQAKPHFISTGAPVHASRWLDLGLDWIQSRN
jgi:nicotinate-nucleotide pyrophosphorylase (carboxylating)